MIYKGMVVLQNCMDEVVPNSYSETCLPDGSEMTDIKVEDVTDIEVKEDPMPITFQLLKDEHEVSYILVCILLFINKTFKVSFMYHSDWLHLTVSSFTARPTQHFWLHN
jgi:hypothetical protein